MKGMLKRALAGVAAAALAVTGLAVGASSASAAGLVSGNQSITFTASDCGQLTGHELSLYKVGEYMEYGTGTYGIQTVSAYEAMVRIAVNEAVDPDVDDDADPLAEVISRTEGSAGNLDQSTNAPYTGSTRVFVNSLQSQGITTSRTADYTVTVGDGEGQTACVVSGDAASVTVSVSPGIYVIYDTTENGSNLSLGMMIGTGPVYGQATVNMKNQSSPDTDKEVVEGADDGTVSVGDVVTYEVTASNVTDPSAYGDGYRLTFTDTPGYGLTVDLGTWNLTLNGKTVDQIQNEGGSVMVSLTESMDGDGETSFTVTLDKAAVTYLIGLDGYTNMIVMRYKATVNDQAPNGEVENTAEVDNNGNASEDTATIRYYGFSFDKVYADGTAAPGAMFTIAEQGSENTVLQTATSSADGKVSFTGLEAGTYVVAETQQADDAQQVLPSFTVTITKDGAITFEDSVASDTFGLVDISEDQKTVTVTNVKSISELPQTGAAGIALFVVLGLLIAGAGAAVWMKSRGVRNAING